jgi:hypothetical protein
MTNVELHANDLLTECKIDYIIYIIDVIQQTNSHNRNWTGLLNLTQEQAAYCQQVKAVLRDFYSF